MKVLEYLDSLKLIQREYPFHLDPAKEKATRCQFRVVSSVANKGRLTLKRGREITEETAETEVETVDAFEDPQAAHLEGGYWSTLREKIEKASQWLTLSLSENSDVF